jgi:3-hydroxyacyl-CoA dehydrogenase
MWTCMRWGFGMKQGPFELWQEAGWLEVAHGAGRHRCRACAVQGAAAGWVFKGPVADAGGVHTAARLLEPAPPAVCAGAQAAGVCPPAFPESVLGSQGPSATAGKHLHEDDAIRLWTLDDCRC